MDRVSESPSIVASKSDGTSLQHGARSCTDDKKHPGRKRGRLLVKIASLIWPRKTAESLADEAHISIRAARYFLAGGESEKAVRAIMREELQD